jgi:hypothetical protein
MIAVLKHKRRRSMATQQKIVLHPLKSKKLGKGHHPSLKGRSSRPIQPGTHLREVKMANMKSILYNFLYYRNNLYYIQNKMLKKNLLIEKTLTIVESDSRSIEIQKEVLNRHSIKDRPLSIEGKKMEKKPLNLSQEKGQPEAHLKNPFSSHCMMENMWSLVEI